MSSSEKNPPLSGEERGLAIAAFLDKDNDKSTSFQSYQSYKASQKADSLWEELDKHEEKERGRDAKQASLEKDPPKADEEDLGNLSPSLEGHIPGTPPEDSKMNQVVEPPPYLNHEMWAKDAAKNRGLKFPQLGNLTLEEAHRHWQAGKRFPKAPVVEPLPQAKTGFNDEGYALYLASLHPHPQEEASRELNHYTSEGYTIRGLGYTVHLKPSSPMIPDIKHLNEALALTRASKAGFDVSKAASAASLPQQHPLPSGMPGSSSGWEISAPTQGLPKVPIFQEPQDRQPDPRTPEPKGKDDGSPVLGSPELSFLVSPNGSCAKRARSTVQLRPRRTCIVTLLC